MGGIIIIVAILIPCLLLGKLDNIYMILMLITTVWLGTLGFWMTISKFSVKTRKACTASLRLSVRLVWD